MFKEIIDQTNNFENTNLESLKIDQSLIDRILKYASIKHILFEGIELFHIPFNRDLHIFNFKNMEVEFKGIINYIKNEI